MTENSPLTDVLTDICAMACEPAAPDGGTVAACILLAAGPAKTIRSAASVGIGPVPEGARTGQLRRIYFDLARSSREAGHRPMVIDDFPTSPLAEALELGEDAPRFGTAWIWPLYGRKGNEAGLLIRFLGEAKAPGAGERAALESCARLASLALAQRRKAPNPARPSDLLETVVDNVNQGIALFGKDMLLLHYNSTYESLYNFADGFLRKGLHYAEVLHHLIERGEFGDVDADAYLRDRMRGMKEGGEWRNLRHKPDGSVIAVYRKNLVGGGALVTLTDVTEDLRLSLENQRNARLLESIVSNINHGVRVIDSEGRMVLWNQRYREMCGYPDHLMQKGMPYEVILRHSAERQGRSPEETREFVRSRLDVVRGGKLVSTQRTLSNGPTVRIDRVPMPEGGFVTTYTDITKLLETESELARKTDLLATTLDIINQGLLVLDPDLNVILFNDSYLQVFGLNPRQIKTGMNYSEVLRVMAESGEFYADSGTTEEIITRRLVRAGSNETQHDVHRRPNGTIVNVYRTSMPGGGRVITFTDISDLKQAEAELVSARDLSEQANRAKTEFLANMSHELRTPLNAIIGFSEIMQAEVFGNIAEPHYRDYVDSINESGNHLLSLINDILDLSKIEIGKAVLDEEILDLADTVRSCLMLVREEAEQGGVSLVAEIPPNFPAYKGDRRRLKQIMINLLQNAVKFTQAGGSVTVGLEHVPGTPVTITIADTGIGMSAEDIPRALERFSQVESGLKRRYEGAGLGLPLAQGMAQMHGGEIKIESAPGQGTTVRVLLPETRMLDPRAADPRQAPETGERPSPLRATSDRR